MRKLKRSRGEFNNLPKAMQLNCGARQAAPEPAIRPSRCRAALLSEGRVGVNCTAVN